MRNNAYEHIRKSAISIILAVSIMLSMLVVGLSLFPKAKGENLLPETRSQEEIKAYIKANPTSYEEAEYSVSPSWKAPYRAGQLSEKTQNDFLRALNQVRYVAGLDEVSLDPDYNELAQAAALVNAANNELSHYPAQPSDMATDLYEQGALGARSSNIGWNYSNPVHALFGGWMDDTDSSNVSDVGHRRWCLNPSMEKTGIGQVDGYYAMYAHDTSKETSISQIAWPAQNMPISMFYPGEAWSYSVGRVITDVEQDALKVTLKNKQTGKEFVFSKNSGEFYIDNGWYGLRGAIIFVPSSDSIPYYSNGDAYEVTITGLETGTISYNVAFFAANNEATGLTLSTDSVTVTEGETAKVQVSLLPEDCDWEMVWLKKNEGLLTNYYANEYCEFNMFDSVLEITGLAKGTTDVTVVLSGSAVSAVCHVTVKEKPQEEPTTKKAEPTTKKEEPTTKKEEPATKPSGSTTKTTTPETVLNGITQGPDGKWAMYKNGKVDTSFTGVAKNQYGWWRVENGYVNFNANGIYQNEYGWWKTTNGKVTFDETGIFKNEYGWWRVKDSKVDFKANGIYQNKYGWWKTTGGKVTFKENGVFKNEYGWWKVENSKVNFKFTGIAKNKYGTWYVKDGKVDFNKNGKVKFNGKTYTVKGGKVQ